MPQKSDRKTLEDAAYQQIRKIILSHKLLPGMKLSEPSLARWINMSRTPIRAALRRLASEGLVSITPNHGAKVTQPTAKDIEDAYFMREKLEPLGAVLACDVIEEKLLETLAQACLLEARSFHTRNMEEYLEANNRFHFTLAAASGNRLLETTIVNCITLTNVYLALLDPFYEIPEDQNRSLVEHRQLVEALRERDALRAETIMRVHIRSSREYVELGECYGRGGFLFPKGVSF